MLAELSERDARGAIADIYAEIRRLWGAPYVSSLQRHLATRPGVLEWAWAAVGPAFSSGRAQTAAWRAVERVERPRLDPLSRDALAVWDVDDDGVTAIGGACESFVRVSPVNLVFSGLLRRLIGGARPAGPRVDAAWTPPSPGPPLLALIDPAELSAPARGALSSLGTRTGDEVFVPGLYRMLARWPGLIAHLATALAPRQQEPATRAALTRVNEVVDAVVPGVFAELPALPSEPPAPGAGELDALRAVLDTYRKTSPEMVVFGGMIRDALPAAGHSG